MTKLTHNSGNDGLDKLIEYAHPSDIDYGYDEVVEFLIMMDDLDIIIAEDMLTTGTYVNTMKLTHDSGNEGS